MFFYIELLFVICIFLLAYKYSRKIREKKICVICVALILILVAGLRYKVGTDYPVYVINYPRYKNASVLNLRYAGIYIIAKIASVLYDDYTTWFFLMSLFTVGGAVYAVYKYSSNFPFSILLYLFIGCWHSSFNVVKQCAAVTVLLLGQRFLFDRKFVKWVFTCLLAASFHISAVFMIPIYFLVTREINVRQLILMFAVAVIVSLSYDKLIDVMSSLKRLDVIDASKSVTTRSVNILRVLVSFAPVILACFFYRGKENENSQTMVLTNFSILNALLYFASMRSVYLTRFCLYTEAFNVFFIPHIISKSKLKTNKGIISFVCFVLYLAFWLYDLSKGSTTSTFHWIFER